VAIGNSRLVADIAMSLGAFTQEGSFERSFTNRFGVSIYEDVLLFPSSQRAARARGGTGRWMRFA